MDDKERVFFKALAQLLTDHQVIVSSGDVRLAINNNNYSIDVRYPSWTSATPTSTTLIARLLPQDTQTFSSKRNDNN